MSYDNFSLVKPFDQKPVKLVVTKNIPYKNDPKEYSELEKMMLGMPHTSYEAAQTNGRHFAKVMCRKLNVSGPLDLEERSKIIKELLGTANNAYIEPPFYCDYGSNIHLGHNVYMNTNCMILDVNEVIIGDNTLIGPGVQIYTATHPVDPIARRTDEYGIQIKIGKDCRIGDGAIILPNVTIGDGVIIEPGSVVNKDIEPYCVAGGNPAKIIKKLPNLQ